MNELQAALDRNAEVFAATWVESLLFAEAARKHANPKTIPVRIVENFLESLTETEAGPDEWPEYQALLAVLDITENTG